MLCCGFCLSSSCLPFVASFSGLSIFLLPFWYSLTSVYFKIGSGHVREGYFAKNSSRETNNFAELNGEG